MAMDEGCVVGSLRWVDCKCACARICICSSYLLQTILRIIADYGKRVDKEGMLVMHFKSTIMYMSVLLWVCSMCELYECVRILYPHTDLTNASVAAPVRNRRFRIGENHILCRNCRHRGFHLMLLRNERYHIITWQGMGRWMPRLPLYLHCERAIAQRLLITPTTTSRVSFQLDGVRTNKNRGDSLNSWKPRKSPAVL